MNKPLFIALSSVALLATSCEQKTTCTTVSSENTIDLTPAFECQDSIAIEMGKDYEFIPLESNDNCILGGYGHIENVGKYIIANSLTGSKNLIFFDHEGKYVTSIYKGNGPGEIKDGNNTHIFYDKKNEIYAIHDFFRFIYLDKNLKFIKDVTYPFLNYQILGIDNGEILICPPIDTKQDIQDSIFSTCKLLVTDDEFNIKRGYLPFNHFGEYHQPENPTNTATISLSSISLISLPCMLYCESKEGWYLKNPLIDSLYLYKDSTITSYAINYPEMIDFSSCPTDAGEGITYINEAKGNQIVSIQNLGKYLKFRFSYYKGGKVDFVTNKIHEYSMRISSRDIESNYFMVAYDKETKDASLCKNEGKTHESISYEMIDNGLDIDKEYSFLTESERNTLKKLGEDDNPVVILYKE